MALPQAASGRRGPAGSPVVQGASKPGHRFRTTCDSLFSSLAEAAFEDLRKRGLGAAAKKVRGVLLDRNGIGSKLWFVCYKHG